MKTTALDRFYFVRSALVILTLFGAYLVCFQISEQLMARQSKSWPRVTGLLSVHTDQYRRNLSYRYAVDGVTYQSDRVIFGEMGNRTRSQEWNAAASLPDGSEVVVYYKPTNPHESTLVPRLLAVSWFHLLLGAAFSLTAIIVLALFPKTKQTAEQAVAGQPT